MKYKDLIQFEPVTEVVQFSKTQESEYQKSLVETFVFSEALSDRLIPLIVNNLDYIKESHESFGLQVVGNYGTGKSHLMSLVSLIAEDESLLHLVKEEKVKEYLSRIAGKFKAKRFEMGNMESLWSVFTFQVSQYLGTIGVDYNFKSDDPLSYAEHIQYMMAAFEEVHPEQGLLIVIDEMLSYLKARSEPTKLNEDLQVLQALGQACANSKFRIIFGVQEAIYSSKEFQFASDMLSKVSDRYKDIIITKEDVAFIVKKRLLNKDEHQKQKIRKHLQSFMGLFKDLHSRTEEYVELFPVHPSYFQNFERIKIGKSQREILKTISKQFKQIANEEVPVDNPGLLTYDEYWDTIVTSQNLMAQPDVHKVKEIMGNVEAKIEEYFIKGRAARKPVAIRIAKACAIKILQEDLDKQNGTSPENLIDDLCITTKIGTERELLLDSINMAAQDIVTATSGQYFDFNKENGTYYIRVTGGTNFDENIRIYAKGMESPAKDQFFFEFLRRILPIEGSTYRTGFKIWAHSIEWLSHKTYREGYLFLGNPNEKSTTEPKQHFYMYFMPIFDLKKNRLGIEKDEVYFLMDGFSKQFKEQVNLYGAAVALEANADTSVKIHYKTKINQIFDTAKTLFDKEFPVVTQVEYQGKQTPLRNYMISSERGASKLDIFSTVASKVFENWFKKELPDYPKFELLSQPITPSNRERFIRSALLKVAQPQQSNKDGEAILAGLKLWKTGALDHKRSPYARSILQKMSDKGAGKVLNRDEILYCYYPPENLWRSNDFELEADLAFLVLAVLAALGEIEIVLSSGENINSGTTDKLKKLNHQDYYTFEHIKPPKGINFAALRAMFLGLLGRDLSNRLKEPETYVELHKAAAGWSKRAVYLIQKLKNGYSVGEITVINEVEAKHYDDKILPFQRFCDRVSAFDSEAKIRNFPFDAEAVKHQLSTTNIIQDVEQRIEEVEELREDINYLSQCKQYLPEIALREQISGVMGALKDTLDANEKKKTKAYAQKLKELKDCYAEWYLEQYLNARISEREQIEKQSLLDSELKYLCDALKDVYFLHSARYQDRLGLLAKMKVADSSVTKTSILTTPYQDGFNPKDYMGEASMAVEDIKSDIEDILSEWVESLRSTLNDPGVKKNLTLLKKGDQDSLEAFKVGELELDRANVLFICRAISDLHQGLEKVELDDTVLKDIFNRPLTPDEAIKTFKDYINHISQGKERSSIRIILK